MTSELLPSQLGASLKKEGLLNQEDPMVFISLTDLHEIAGKRPSHYKLPNSTVLKINTWKDVLRESCQFALKNNPSISIPFPDRVGRKVSLLSYDKPAKGLAFFYRRI
jgi:hypothetical protein